MGSKLKISEAPQRSGVGILTVLQIIFIVLKVAGLVAWSWWVVLIPLWISLGLTVLAVICIMVIAFLAEHDRSKK